MLKTRIVRLFVCTFYSESSRSVAALCDDNHRLDILYQQQKNSWIYLSRYSATALWNGISTVRLFSHYMSILQFLLKNKVSSFPFFVSDAKFSADVQYLKK